MSPPLLLATATGASSSSHHVPRPSTSLFGGTSSSSSFARRPSYHHRWSTWTWTTRSSFNKHNNNKKKKNGYYSNNMMRAVVVFPNHGHNNNLQTATTSRSRRTSKEEITTAILLLRGGGAHDNEDQDENDHDHDHDTADHDDHDDEHGNDNDNSEDHDNERYSRQVYAVGKRAHNLIRLSTVYIDGPSASGLTYECAKNLALSGIQHIVFIVSDNDNENDDNDNKNDMILDRNYHNPHYDDLGCSYQRAAETEVSSSTSSSSSSLDDDPHDPTTNNNNSLVESQQRLLLVVEYIKRLNPNIMVTTITRSSLFQQQQDQQQQDQQQDQQQEQKSPICLLCVDRPYTTQVKLNELCRLRQIKFVSVETAGIYGRLFCDFNNHIIYDADGEIPVITPLDKIEIIQTQTSMIVVHCIEEEKHDVSKGDRIQFQYRNGKFEEQTTCIVVDVQTPYRFVVEMMKSDDDNDDNDSTKAIDDVAFVSRINRDASTFRRIKIPQTISFLSLQEAMAAAASRSSNNDASLFAACDLEKSFDQIRIQTTLACFQAMTEFVRTNRRLPTLSDVEEFETLVQDEQGVSSLCTDDDEASQKKKKHCHHFVRTCAAKLVPFQAVFGAMASQEVLKAVTGLYNPVRQILVYDCDEIILPNNDDDDDETAPLLPTAESSVCDNNNNKEAAGLRHILGDDTVDRLQKQKVFVVGVGAIGCEILKNLAPMGVATGKKGKLILTDMDTIEKSNLSRQLLFRDNDIGKFKSIAARQASLRLNPAMRIEAHSSKVGTNGGSSSSTTDQHGPFDDRFWSKKVDIVLNALDNVEARLYMDVQCVANRKALVDAGTMGPKGNVQVVVPNQSESYASSADPPEPAIPVCTLKNFPYAISHTIQWARELFDGLFQQRPEQANDFIESLSSSESSSLETLAQKFLQEKGEEAAIETAQELSEDLTAETTASEVEVRRIRDSALAWATQLAFKLYYKASSDLLSEHPRDSLDEDGEPFWSGTRTPPKLLSFDPSSSVNSEQITINHNLIEFVRNAARLRVEAILGDDRSVGDSVFSEKEAEHALNHAYGFEDQTKDAEKGSSTSQRVRALLGSVQTGPRRLAATEFEKDDESNGHVAFVSAASNLRAIVYGIPPVDAMETRRVAGNIVPAMITTTAFVSALSCIELIKLVQGAELKKHRNAFINLALPFFAFTIPLPAEEMPGLRGKQYTLWDRLSIRESQKMADKGGITVKSLLKKIRRKASDDPSLVEVAAISCGPYMLYANFLHEDDNEVLKASLWDLVKDAVSSGDSFEKEFSRDGGNNDDSESVSWGDIAVHRNYVDLTVVVEDVETGDEVELPPLRVKRFEP